MRGVLVKCNIDRIRPATDSEWLGAELIKILSADAKQHLERNGQRGFVDATREEGPDPDVARPSEDSTLPTGPLDSIPEEREVTPDNTGARNDVENLDAGTPAPAAPPSQALAVPFAETLRRVSNSTETRNVRARTTSELEPLAEPSHATTPALSDTMTEPEVSDAVLDTVATLPGTNPFTPQGGWTSAADRSAARSSPYSSFVDCNYVSFA